MPAWVHTHSSILMETKLYSSQIIWRMFLGIAQQHLRLNAWVVGIPWQTQGRWCRGPKIAAIENTSIETKSKTDVWEAQRTFFLPCKSPALSGKHYKSKTPLTPPCWALALPSLGGSSRCPESCTHRQWALETVSSTGQASREVTGPTAGTTQGSWRVAGLNPVWHPGECPSSVLCTCWGFPTGRNGAKHRHIGAKADPDENNSTKRYNYKDSMYNKSKEIINLFRRK